MAPEADEFHEPQRRPPVHSVAGFYKVPVESILVAYDEPPIFRRASSASSRAAARAATTACGISSRRWATRSGACGSVSAIPVDKSAVLNYVLGRPQADDERQIFEAIQAAVDIVAAAAQ